VFVISDAAHQLPHEEQVSIVVDAVGDQLTGDEVVRDVETAAMRQRRRRRPRAVDERDVIGRGAVGIKAVRAAILLDAGHRLRDAGRRADRRAVRKANVVRNLAGAGE
jgi:hypothetical protein